MPVVGPHSLTINLSTSIPCTGLSNSVHIPRYALHCHAGGRGRGRGRGRGSIAAGRGTKRSAGDEGTAAGKEGTPEPPAKKQRIKAGTASECKE
jgi:hypothetical protein